MIINQGAKQQKAPLAYGITLGRGVKCLKMAFKG
jgi:hypothetical protein